MPYLIVVHSVLLMLVQFLLLALQQNLKQVITSDQVRIQVLFGQNDAFTKYLLVHHFLLYLQDIRQALEGFSEESTVWPCEDEPVFQTREDVDLLMGGFIEDISDVSSVAVGSIRAH